MPSRPHEPAPSSGQSFRGSVLFFDGPHVPSEPLALSAAAHAWHVPVHEVSQHTPSTQNPLVQPFAVLHAAPNAACERHVPASQKFPLAQSPSLAHVLEHAPPEHRYGAHVAPDCATQVPRPSHALAT